MAKRRVLYPAIILPAIAATMFVTKPAHAIPAFAQQTGQPCTACHIGAFGPQLTPLGRAFKIGGYTQTGGDGWAAHVPLSLMVIGSFTHTGADQNPPPQHYAANNNFSLDQVSGFVGGNIGQHSGGLMQFTWTDVDNTAHVDNADLRPYTTVFDLGGKELRIGFTLNNAPTVQDPYNSTFAWGFPYITSAIAPTPVGNPMLAGALAGNAIGYTAYAWYDNKLYLEAGAYSTVGPYLLARFGNDYGIGATTSPAPYLRAAYEWDWGNNAAWVGALFMHADAAPPSGVPYQATGVYGYDHYTDYAVDAGYQFLSDGTHIATIQGIYTHEDQNLKGSAGALGIAGSQYTLDQFRINTSYWYKNTYGLTLGWQKTWGPANPVLFGLAGVTSANNRPDSNEFIVEADWVPFGKDSSLWAPFANLKLGVQYTVYTQFDGATRNYDGAGANPGNNNTLLLLAWTIF
ncbi:MAG TPA: hypothetical protein VHO91_16420 [Rhodopila sp.]|nr:hypothetical protein [Rhodopila sp.]